MSGFVHLHVQSHFSLLESTITIPGLVKQVKTLGMKAVAVTDHGSLFGALEFQKVASKEGIKPIFGCQISIAPLGMKEKTVDCQQMVLLAMNDQGWKDLSRLVSLGWEEGFYYEARVDIAAIRAHAANLMCLTGAGNEGYLNRHLVSGAASEAERKLSELAEIFPDRLYVELTDHGHEGPTGLRHRALDLARALKLPVVASNWVHYLKPEDHAIHDVLLAIGKATALSDAKRRRMPSREFWLKSADAMAQLFSDIPEALENTLVIAERCTAKIPTGTYHLPTFTPESGLDVPGEVRRLSEEGLKSRYDTITPEYRERLDFELEVIIKSGFAAYFLIVADFINWAKRNGIPVGPGRGSAAGSLVAYCMGITDICPMRYGLLFERFLNPGRKSMPDIDVDFCRDGRGRVIEYVAQKYGQHAVSQIMTLGTMKARMAIKDVCRAYEWTPEESQELANLITDDPSGKMTIAVCLGKAKGPTGDNSVPKLVARYADEERTRTVLDAAMQVERLGRNLGVHACGIIIAPGPVHDYAPVCVIKEKPATQFNMGQVEECGLLKMDFLGLKTMSILKRAADLVQRTAGITIDYPRLPLDDKKTFELLGSGDTLGVFQCESSGFQELIRTLKPDRFEDMIALVALYRPGPLSAGMHTSYCHRKHGTEAVEYPHPCLETILKETHGLYIYQEQVMQISRTLSGFTPAEADDLRKAMGKKMLDVLAKYKEKFVEGAWNLHQFDKGACTKMWENILGFASYGFNKSHSACYGLIAYWTAYMKANHFGAFMTANMVYEMGNTAKMTEFIQDMSKKGIPVRPPDVNGSEWEFTFNGREALFGFGGIKSVGEAAAENIIEVRKKGPFLSLFDYCERINQRSINKRVTEHLIKTGAFDALHPNRAAMAAGIERAYERGARLLKQRSESQLSLFGEFEADEGFRRSTQTLPDIPDWPQEERLRYEKALAGRWMSGHPLDPNRAIFAPHVTHTIKDLIEGGGGKVSLAAVITHKRPIRTKSGRGMMILTLEDGFGAAEAVLFGGKRTIRGYEPGPFERFGEEVKEDQVVLVRGNVDRKDRRSSASKPVNHVADDGEIPEVAEAEPAADEPETLPSIIVQDIVPVSNLTERCTREVEAIIDASCHNHQTVTTLVEHIRSNPGTCPLKILFYSPGGVLLTLEPEKRWGIHPSAECLGGLRNIVGGAYLRTRLEVPKN